VAGPEPGAQDAWSSGDASPEPGRWPARPLDDPVFRAEMERARAAYEGIPDRTTGIPGDEAVKAAARTESGEPLTEKCRSSSRTLRAYTSSCPMASTSSNGTNTRRLVVRARPTVARKIASRSGVAESGRGLQFVAASRRGGAGGGCRPACPGR
jgi:hypothetical protein